MNHWRPIGMKARPQGFMRYTGSEPEYRDDVDLNAPDMLAAEYLRQGNATENRLLNPDLDESTRSRLEAYLQIWKILWEQVTIAYHWSSGDGDRKLF